VYDSRAAVEDEDPDCHIAGLALTARAEAQVATHSSDHSETATPGASGSPLSLLLPSLLSASEEETAHPTDAFEARVCIAWIHWVLDDPATAAAELPRNITATLRALPDANSKLQQWVYACAVKAAYIEGHSLEETTRHSEAIAVYTSMLSFLSASPSTVSTTPQFCLWSELIITRLCTIAMKSKPFGSELGVPTMLEIFRIWNTLWNHGLQKLSIQGEKLRKRSEYSRRDVWRAYYKTLLHILQQGYVYSPTSTPSQPALLETAEGMSDDEYRACKLKQRSEIKQVEATISKLLFAGTKFPKSSERNVEVEKWVEDVMSSWRTMCGPTWTDAEIGEGGKDAVSRSVLDVSERCHQIIKIDRQRRLIGLRSSTIQQQKRSTPLKYCAICS